MLGWILWVTSDSGQVTSDPQNLLPGDFYSGFSSFLYQYYISPHYPRNFKKGFSKGTFERETLAIHLRVRDCSPTIIYTISLKFSFTPTSPTTRPLEVLNPNTYLTQFESCEKFWCIWEVLKEAIDWHMQFGANCGIWITSEDMAPSSLLVVGTWRIQVHWVD